MCRNVATNNFLTFCQKGCGRDIALRKNAFRANYGRRGGGGGMVKERF